MHRILVIVLVLVLHVTSISTKEQECTSIDFRNSPDYGVYNKSIDALKNCTIVRGFLQVVLMDSTKEEEFNHMVFPLLKEVTGFVFFFRVRGLKNIGKNLLLYFLLTTILTIFYSIV